MAYVLVHIKTDQTPAALYVHFRLNNLRKRMNLLSHKLWVRSSIQWEINFPIKTPFFNQQSCPYYYMGALHWLWQSVLRKKLDGNYARMLSAILTKSRKQHSTMQQLYGNLPPISKTIQIRRTRHGGYSWRTHRRRSHLESFTQTCKCYTSI